MDAIGKDQNKVCAQCGQTYKDIGYKKTRKYCSFSCYLLSPSRLLATVNGGKSHKGKEHWWGYKIAQSKTGKPRLDMQKEKNWNWKGGIDYGRRNEMQSIKYQEWRRQVFERDKYTCQICKDKNGNGKTIKLIAHHRAPWHKYLKWRYNVNNGMTICKEDHIIGHQLFGYNYKLT